MAQDCSDTVVSRIAASYDHDMFPFGCSSCLSASGKESFCVLSEEIHSKADAGHLLRRHGTGRFLLRSSRDFPHRYRQGSRFFGAARKDHSVKILKDRSRSLRVHVHSGPESHAFRLHELLPALDNGFIKFHIRDPVHQKSADPVLALEDGHLMPSVVELVRRRKARGTAADDSHFFAAALCGNPGLHPTAFESCLNDIQLVVVDRDGIVIHPAYTGLLTQSRTYAAGEFREIACLEEP